jgi:IS4 transposase
LARHQGDVVSDYSTGALAAADWTIYLTNVSSDRLTLQEALVLGRARWQIELLFKLWKRYGSIDESRSAHPWRILCELYAKLLAMVIQHWVLLTTCWRCPDRSLVKAG